MPTTLRFLLQASRFRLTPVGECPGGNLDAPLLWAHSSDLPDPTPWLEPDGLLLTDGVQFLPAQATDPASYVTRLRSAGVTALGFATRIVHDRIPSALVEECHRHGLALVEVAHDTPFMSIIRFVTDAVAADQRERLERSLRAQRSVARAALRPDALGAILGELERHLGAWVALYDAAGDRVQLPTRHAIPSAIEATMAKEVSATLRRGRPTGGRVSGPDGTGITLQTIGQRGALRGALVVGGAARLDRGDSDLVGSVIALASIALEQSRALDTARRALRSGVLELLSAGEVDVAERTARHLSGGLPQEPMRVVRILTPPDGEGRDAVTAALEMLIERRKGRLFAGQRGEDIYAVVTHDDVSPLRTVLDAHGVRAGSSAPSLWCDFPAALVEARHAARVTRAERPFVAFDELSGDGLVGYLERTGGREVARDMLAPLDAHPEGPQIRETLLVWLRHNGAWHPAAKVLGIHRHTLRLRVENAAGLLGMDLETFDARAQLWTAMRLNAEP